MALLSSLNIKPMRVAFDHVKDKNTYVHALKVARKYGIKEFSNYMLYNWKDTPRDLYDRLVINIRLNEKWGKGTDRPSGAIYSYPMRYAPIKNRYPDESNRNRDYVPIAPEAQRYQYESEKEVDAIINYDIKYRMGLGGEETEEVDN